MAEIASMPTRVGDRIDAGTIPRCNLLANVSQIEPIAYHFAKTIRVIGRKLPAEQPDGLIGAAAHRPM